MTGKLGLREVLAMGVGGVIGGGIFAALGVAAHLAGNAAFITYLLASLIALASGYSYVKMTEHLKEDGGSFTFLEHYVSNKNIAGMVGWILIVGYIGTMAMYAYAFGSFSSELLGLASNTFFRKIISVGILGVFVGVNFLGAEKTGESEDILVYFKILILLIFGLTGLWTIFARPEFSAFSQSIFNKGVLSPVIAIGTVFVSFEGWQLLTYEYSDMEGGIYTLRKGIIGTIIISTVIYILTAIVTTSLLTPETIIQQKETVLAVAAGKIFQNSLLSKIFGVTVSLAALFSTASAINATMFGTARFTHRIATENDLPQIFSFRNKEGVPSKSLIVIGLLTGLFTLTGSLEEITAFASLAFIIIFGVVNYVCLKDQKLEKITLIPLTGLIGALAVFLLEITYLIGENPHLLIFVTGIFSLLLLLELIYFKREQIEDEADKMEKEVEKEVTEAEKDLEEFEEDLEKESEKEAENLAENIDREKEKLKDDVRNISENMSEEK